MTIPPIIEEINVEELSVSDPAPIRPTLDKPYPAAMISVTEEQLQRFKIFVREWLQSLQSSHQTKQAEWVEEEKAYNAEPDTAAWVPFEGACQDTVPLIAMGVDPIQARISLGIFKQDTAFKFKALKKDFIKYTESLEDFFEYYQKHRMQFRRVFDPRSYECIKHGTMVFNVEYDRETYDVKTYDRADSWKVVKRPVTRYAGPRIRGVPLTNFLFPPHYEHLQACPIIFEKMLLLWDELKIQEANGKIINLDKIKDQTTDDRSDLEEEQAKSSKHEPAEPTRMYYELYRGCADFDIDGDGIPERLIFTYHQGQDEFIQLCYNWYFHQKKPYVVIPYSKATGSLYGLGYAKMIRPLQDALTKWERIARDNAYLANIRGFAVSKSAGIENKPKWYSGRVIRMNDPSKDIREIKLSDIYNSTLSERQNVIGLAEKRGGVSDYLTGRESPILGSRATATSTVALISEGTKRVEQVMENVRDGVAEIGEMCLMIWAQYGLDNILEQAFGSDDPITINVRDFFDQVTAESLIGGMGIDLAATDSTNNKAIQQQMRMSVMQMLMTYYEKFIQIAQMMAQVGAQSPEMGQAIMEVAKAARMSFRDLLQSYDIRNPDEYLPDLERIFERAAAEGQGGLGEIEGLLASVRQRAGLAPAGPVAPMLPPPVPSGTTNGAGPA